MSHGPGFGAGGRVGAWLVGVAVCLLTTQQGLRAEDDAGVPFPRGFRGWTHVKSALIGPQSAFFETAGGLHHVYANGQAAAGFRSGKFTNGAVLVFELLKTVEDAGVTSEGARQRVDVMVKDSRSHGDSGGWAFARYMGEDETKDVLTASERAACFACHQKAEQQDYVFSRLREELRGPRRSSQ